MWLFLPLTQKKEDSDINDYTATGRLTQEVKINKDANGNSVADYTLAINRRFKRDGEPDADFISCVAFGKSADFAEKYFKKGTKIGITGRLQSRSYVNKDGNKVYVTEVVVATQDFMEKKSDGAAAPEAELEQ